MPEITPQQLEEYQMLQRYHRKQLELESIQGLTLEQDIDAPIKKCVMAFALLGCAPLWSCCGFDYYGQPIHKWHEYGRVFFILTNNDDSIKTLKEFVAQDKNGWVICAAGRGAIDLHLNFLHPIPEWDNKDCPHYYEQASVNIARLEGFLLGMKDSMAQEVVLTDTAGAYKKAYPSWQYPPRGNWLIRKEGLYV